MFVRSWSRVALRFDRGVAPMKSLMTKKRRDRGLDLLKLMTFAARYISPSDLLLVLQEELEIHLEHSFE